MYRVVGCRECGALWIVADRPESTSCPRCGTRHRFEQLHAFAETEDEDAARQARAALLADRAGQGEAFAELDEVTAGQLDTAIVSDEEYLEASGLDADAVAEAGERAQTGPARSPNRREAMFHALDELDQPTESEVVSYVADRGVPAEAATELLERLVRAGEVSESGGRYRQL